MRVCVMVLDSVGIGAMPDAHEYGDARSHTLGNIYKARGKLHIPNLLSMGLGNIEDSRLPKVDSPSALYGRMAEVTKAKDTTSGHWEMMGLVMDPPFRVFDKFPEQMLYEWLARAKRKPGFLGNCAASGTGIMSALGGEHLQTGFPIVYTSADSVFQVAAHEEVIPLGELYDLCKIARDMLVGDLFVGRVIARPFVGTPGDFRRTENRKDYAVPPTGKTVLDALEEEGLTTLGIGKIEDIFCNKGVKNVNHTTNNQDSIQATIDALMRNSEDSLIFANLIDFDMKYGHRNDVEGYALALEEFDRSLPHILAAMRQDDVLMLTADHGCDPTTSSTDHSREYVPLLVKSRLCKKPAQPMGIHQTRVQAPELGSMPSKMPANLGTRASFADLGASVYELLTGKTWHTGKSFLKQIRDE